MRWPIVRTYLSAYQCHVVGVALTSGKHEIYDSIRVMDCVSTLQAGCNSTVKNRWGVTSALTLRQRWSCQKGAGQEAEHR